jgi:hypothetical protein
MEEGVDVLTIRDVLRPGPRQWVNAVVVVRMLGQPSDEEMGDITDTTPHGTVMWSEADLIRFTWPVDSPVAAEGALESSVTRARDAVRAAGCDAVPIEARLEVAPSEW